MEDLTGNGKTKIGIAFGVLGKFSDTPEKAFLSSGSTKLGFIGTYGKVRYSVDTIFPGNNNKISYLMGTVSLPVFNFD
jgi:hypothetical protein